MRVIDMAISQRSTGSPGTPLRVAPWRGKAALALLLYSAVGVNSMMQTACVIPQTLDPVTHEWRSASWEEVTTAQQQAVAAAAQATVGTVAAPYVAIADSVLRVLSLLLAWRFVPVTKPPKPVQPLPET